MGRSEFLEDSHEREMSGYCSCEKGQIKQMGGPTSMSRSQAESLLAMIDAREGPRLLSRPLSEGTGMVNGVQFAYVKVG